MKNVFFVIGFITFSAFIFHPKPKIKLWLIGDSTIAIKEKKAYPETGWGMPFANFWDSTITIENRAKNGRSSKSFMAENLWQPVLDNLKEGDYVFIQFGHNDEAVSKAERYSTPDTFKMNLTRYVKETRARKAIPILITPVSRRKFNGDGNVVETHVYSPLVRKIATELNVPLIDLDKKSMELYQQFGVENSKLLFLQLKPGAHPNYPEGVEDNTHFNELGARLIAQLVLKEIKELKLQLADRIVIPAKKNK